MDDFSLRSIPSVDRVLRSLPMSPLPLAVVTSVVRMKLALERDRLLADSFRPSMPDTIVAELTTELEALARTRLTPVINATGVVLHTNLARSPLSADAVAAVTAAAGHYTNLEFDLDTGERGSRGAYLERLLALLCEAPAATVVNNCAAALVLILKHLTTAERPEVIISRGELVQIGGGFRIPEILEASHATLREVGTTNRTTVDDYRSAITPRTAMLLKVHRGNFYMDGFVDSPTTVELVNVAKEMGVPLVFDVGSGAVTSLVPATADAEPSPANAMRDGVDLVCFSGDKLLGGPQAGIIAGRADLVPGLKRDPFFRALRCDKLVFAALQATVEAHLRGTTSDLPIATMLGESTDALRTRAENIRGELADPRKPAPEVLRRPGPPPNKSESKLDIQIEETHAAVGGGTMPRTRIPSIALSVGHPDLKADALAAALRRSSLPLIGVITGDRVRLDLRTVFPSQDKVLVEILRKLAEA